MILFMLSIFALGSKSSIDFIILSSSESSSISVLNLKSIEFKSPPYLGKKGFSAKFVSNKFLTACFTAAYKWGYDWVERGYCDAFNIGQNVGKEAGQTVMYPHVHLIPRRVGDMDDPKGGVRGVIPEKQKYTDEDAKRRDGSFNTQEIIEAQERILKRR